MRHHGRGEERSTLAEQFELFVGIDWASESHEVCVLDAERRIIDRKTIEHSGTGMAQLCDLLAKLSNDQPSRVAVAIETPREFSSVDRLRLRASREFSVVLRASQFKNLLYAISYLSELCA